MKKMNGMNSDSDPSDLPPTEYRMVPNVTLGRIYEIRVNGYSTLCHVEAKTIIGAINCVVYYLNVGHDDILEVKKILRNIPVEFKTKK